MGGACSFPNSSKMGTNINRRTGLWKMESPGMRLVEGFIGTILHEIPPEIGMKLLVENPDALDFFAQYLQTNGDNDNSICMDPEYSDIKSMKTIELTKLLKKELRTYFSSRHTDVSTPDLPLVKYMIMSWYSFLTSDLYMSWRLTELSQIRCPFKMADLETTLPELELAGHLNGMEDKIDATADACPKFAPSVFAEVEFYYNGNNENEEHFDTNLVRAMETNLTEEPWNEININTAEKALNNCDQIELLKLYKNDVWIRMFIVAAEYLPIGITLSSASHDRPGFPFVYVNREFERMSGCTREEVIGKSCKFMQSHELLHLPNQKENVHKLYISLRNAESAVTVINSKRINGEYFTNMVGVKPIVDQSRTYRYAITLQMDISSDNKLLDFHSKMKRLLKMLPSQMFVDNIFFPSYVFV